jgi:metal-dependent amidase/aminoacylase/carboxypeptidase family protein
VYTDLSCAALSVIPSESKLKFGIRAPTAREVMELVPRVLNCFKAGALASGCTYDITISHVYLDLQPCTKLEEFYQEHCRSRWGAEGYETPNRSAISASTDFVSDTPVTRTIDQLNSVFPYSG